MWRDGRRQPGARSGSRGRACMPLDPCAKRFLDRLAALNPPSALSLSVAERREALAQPSESVRRRRARRRRLRIGSSRAPPEHCPCVSTRRPGSAARVCRAWCISMAAAWSPGTLDTYDGIARELAHASGCRLMSVGYRLAPEAPFPAAVDDACAATAWIAAHSEISRSTLSALGVARRFGRRDARRGGVSESGRQRAAPGTAGAPVSDPGPRAS